MSEYDTVHMMPTDGWHPHQHSSGRHRVAAWVAALVSLFVHIVLLLFLPDRSFEVMPAMMPRRAPRDESILLRDVEMIPREALPQMPERTLTDSPLQDAVALSERVDRMPDADPDLLTPEPLQPDTVLPPDSARPPAAAAIEPSFPRPDVLVIDQAFVQAELPGLERRRIPRVEQTHPVTEMSMSPALKVPDAAALQLPEIATPAAAEILPQPVVSRYIEVPVPGVIAPEVSQVKTEIFKEPAEVISPAQPLENFLRVNLAVHESRRDRDYGYFRLEIERRGESELPIIPKDIMLIQDVSASITEPLFVPYMPFCRDGLIQSLDELGPDDRFNIMTFRDRVHFCFDDWRGPDLDNLRQARQYIREIGAHGGSDIYESMRELLEFTAEGDRPIVAVLITDGIPSLGLRESTEIIGRFTAMNRGRISVFSIGIAQHANKYLLDLLSYCNRGDVIIERSGRWGLPETIANTVRQISRMVLSDVRFVFAGRGIVETYPVDTANLYLDRPLVIYGRYPRGLRVLVFRAAGRSGEREGDMIFQIPLSAGERGGRDLRQEWANQKVYFLLGLYARTRDPRVMQALIETSREFSVQIPYRRDI